MICKQAYLFVSDTTNFKQKIFLSISNTALGIAVEILFLEARKKKIGTKSPTLLGNAQIIRQILQPKTFISNIPLLPFQHYAPSIKKNVILPINIVFFVKNLP